MSAFNGATLMITGGTGSFGHTILKHFLTSDIGQIRMSLEEAVDLVFFAFELTSQW